MLQYDNDCYGSEPVFDRRDICMAYMAIALDRGRSDIERRLRKIGWWEPTALRVRGITFNAGRIYHRNLDRTPNKQAA